MTLENTHYDAFISYRHTEPDMFVAQTLQRELESFRLPKNLVKKLGADGAGKTRIRRVFRDQDELPISSDLKDPILLALKNADFLIVICTPRLPQSLWCRTEIEQFIAMHGRERVLAVLAEGEPQDAFPPQLRYIEENGRRKEIEPLAADVRGLTRREIRKKIKEETVRLAAPIFGCGYDDLRQRHRERRLKRVAAATAAAAAVCFVFGAVSAAMAMRISNQAAQIEIQKAKIEEQYAEVLKINAETQAAEALRILDTGDRLRAVETALAALPGPNNPEQPHTPQAQYALTQSLGVYEGGTRVLPRHMLQHDAAVTLMKVSPGGERLLTVDNYGKVYVWDAPAGVLLYEAMSVWANDKTVGFLNDNRIFFSMESGIAVHDLSTAETVYIERDCSADAVAVSGDGSRFVLADYNEAVVFDIATLQPVSAYVLPEERGYSRAVAIDEHGERVAVMWNGGAGVWGQKTSLEVLDANSAARISAYSLGEQEIKELCFSNEYLLATTSFQERDLTDYAEEVRCYVPGERAPRWTHTAGAVNALIPFEDEGGRRILFISYDEIKILKEDTGEIIAQTSYPVKIISAACMENGRFAGICLRNGEYHSLYFNDMISMNMSGSGAFKTVAKDLSDAVEGKGFLASYDYNATGVVIHATALAAACEIPGDYGYVADILVKKDERAVIVQASDSLTAINPVENEILWTFQPEEPIIAAAYQGAEQETVVVAHSQKICWLDAATGRVKEEKQLESLAFSSIKFSADGSRFALSDPRNLHIYDAVDCTLLKSDERLAGMESAGAYGLAEDLETYAVACPAEKKLLIYNIGEEKPVKSLSINAASISQVMIDKGAGRLYVTYLDKKAEMYALSSGALLKTYTGLPFELRQVRRIQGEEMLLQGPAGACVTAQNGEPVAMFGGICAALVQNGRYITAADGTLLSFPIYDTDMLRREARSQLDGSKR